MAKIALRVKLDVTKIDKALLFKGAKGVYLDTTVFVDLDEQDQYGNNGMVTQDVSKEDREGGKKGPILGNVTIFWRDDSAPAQQQQTAPQQSPPLDIDDDIPF